MSTMYTAHAVLGVRISGHLLEPSTGREPYGYDRANQMLCGFPLLWGDGKRYAYVGRMVRTGDSDIGPRDRQARVLDDEPKNWREALQNGLGSLYDDEEFGMWAVLV